MIMLTASVIFNLCQIHLLFFQQLSLAALLYILCGMQKIFFIHSRDFQSDLFSATMTALLLSLHLVHRVMQRSISSLQSCNRGPPTGIRNRFLSIDGKLTFFFRFHCDSIMLSARPIHSLGCFQLWSHPAPLSLCQMFLSGTTTLNVTKKWSFQTGGRSKQVQCAWNPVVDRNFHKLEIGLSRQGGRSRGGCSDRFHCSFVAICQFSNAGLATGITFYVISILQSSGRQNLFWSVV